MSPAGKPATGDDEGRGFAVMEELVAAFEGEFDIEMDDEAALKVQTVGDAVSFIGKYLD